MRRAWLWRMVTAAFVAVLILPTTAFADTSQAVPEAVLETGVEIRLVYGSFSVEENAHRFASELTTQFLLSLIHISEPTRPY